MGKEVEASGLREKMTSALARAAEVEQDLHAARQRETSMSESILRLEKELNDSRVNVAILSSRSTGKAPSAPAPSQEGWTGMLNSVVCFSDRPKPRRLSLLDKSCLTPAQGSTT